MYLLTRTTFEYVYFFANNLIGTDVRPVHQMAKSGHAMPVSKHYEAALPAPVLHDLRCSVFRHRQEPEDRGRIGGHQRPMRDGIDMDALTIKKVDGRSL
jgi:hypothetical protein